MKPPLFSCLSSRIANNGSLYGRFLLGPLPIDISLTVATVLRRSLLHSQATFSIVSAEIEGATHEYASLPGIQESVLEILLNLGEIVLTTSQRNYLNPTFRTTIGTDGFYFAFIRVTGPGIVTSKDINWPKGIFCVKPDIVICTLSSNETLTMRLKIACSLNKNKQSLIEIEENIKSITSNGINKKAFYDLENQGKENTFNSYNSPDGSFGGPNDSVSSVTNKRNSKNSALFAFFAPLTLSGISSSSKAHHGTIDDWGSTLPSKKKDKFLINNQNQFNFFKFNKIKQSVTLLTSLKSPEINLKSLNDMHFKRIKKKILLLSKTFLSEGIKSRITFLEDQRTETKKLITKFPRKKDDKELINSYSHRKEKTRSSFLKKTNEQSIFNENRNQSIKNVINISNKNDDNVTFRVFPGLFNDFLEAPIKKQINQNEELKNKELELQRLWQSNKNKKANLKGYNQNSNYENQEVLSTVDKTLNTHSQSPFEQDDSKNQVSKENSTITESGSTGIGSRNHPTEIISSEPKENGSMSNMGPNTLNEISSTSQAKPSRELKNISINKELEKQKTNLEVPKFQEEQRRKYELVVSNSSYPVEKVNFLIERDDELAGYRHRIILEVWTNGSISPRQAIFESIGSIIKLIYNFREPLRTNFN